MEHAPFCDPRIFFNYSSSFGEIEKAHIYVQSGGPAAEGDDAGMNAEKDCRNGLCDKEGEKRLEGGKA